MLDTHALMWWVNGDKELSRAGRRAIEAELKSDEASMWLSAISAWEAALLVGRGCLALSMDVDDWLNTVNEESLDVVRCDCVGDRGARVEAKSETVWNAMINRNNDALGAI